MQHVAGKVRSRNDPLAADQHGQQREQQAALGYSQIKAAAKPAAVAVWAEGKLCDAALTAEHRQPLRRTLPRPEPSKSSGRSYGPGAEDEHFQQVGRPAGRQRAGRHPRDGPAPGGIELMQHQQHQHHPKPVPERLEHVEIAQIGVNRSRCNPGWLRRSNASVSWRPADRRQTRQPRPAASSRGQEESPSNCGGLSGMASEVVLAWKGGWLRVCTKPLRPKPCQVLNVREPVKSNARQGPPKCLKWCDISSGSRRPRA